MTSARSALSQRAYFYIEQGYSVVPIAPGTKRPGVWTKEHGWRGSQGWVRYNDRLPSLIEQQHWETWPDAGIGLVCGKLSGVVAIDRDYDAPGTDALEKIIPYSPVKKRGAKGYTAFFRYRNENSRSFNSNGMRVLDLLSDGRQTLMPDTVHPDGMTYRYLTEDCLEEMKAEDLPYLPENFAEQVIAVLAPYQTDDDRKFQRTTHKPHTDTAGSIATDITYSTAYFHDLNRAALAQLHAWVPKLIAMAREERDGYRTIATWRNCERANVGIHESGIFDFGGNYGMTPIDLVMAEHGLPFGRAAEQLRALVDMDEPEPIIFTNQRAPRIQAAQLVDEKGVTAVEKPAGLLRNTITRMHEPSAVIGTVEPLATLQTPIGRTTSQIPSFVDTAPGLLGVITNYIRATAHKAQPEMALAAAIAICATVMQRRFRSQYGNYTPLFFVLVARSTEGKEHPLACVDRVLQAANLSNLIAGSGYTSPGAVHSELMRKPSHVVIIDEFGKWLKFATARGNSYAEGALDKLVEVYGRNDGVLRPPAYSTMTIGKGSLPVGDRSVHNPAITLIAATTPNTFYGGLSDTFVQDGFLGRCTVVDIDAPRQRTRMVDKTPPTDAIVKWCIETNSEVEKFGNLAGATSADTPPVMIPFMFEEECQLLLVPFEDELNRLKDQHEADGLDVLLGRTYEKALRLSMIVAKCTRPEENIVRAVDLQYAIDYMLHYDLQLLESVSRKRARNDTDVQIKKLVGYIKNAKNLKDKKFLKILAKGYLPHTKALNLMSMTSKPFEELIRTAIEMGIIVMSRGDADGYAGKVYSLVDP
ncbi:bifunctional DNA primase/polymerase [Caballeronia sordidicola]|uniref:DNA primase/polymerase bifunctional N-terminal domain-containing protein n=1 Tax=Caballeronia sordidicola TaxID=196367 RepID=A0A242MEY6_CABSO|nr:bifunctional DNA primase/polymerase [Caballeronia sordidicola]OTP69747.1 hypothetical protein PAMC26577_28925 [Caballeronia sordidicola]